MYRESLKEGTANPENLKDIMGEDTLKSPKTKDLKIRTEKNIKPMKSILFEHSDEEEEDSSFNDKFFSKNGGLDIFGDLDENDLFEENEDDYHDAICNDSSWETSSQPDDQKEEDLGEENETPKSRSD